VENRPGKTKRAMSGRFFIERESPAGVYIYTLPEVFRRRRPQTGGEFFQINGAASPSAPTIFKPKVARGIVRLQKAASLQCKTTLILSGSGQFQVPRFWAKEITHPLGGCFNRDSIPA
jgi:hypothetical protein